MALSYVAHKRVLTPSSFRTSLSQSASRVVCKSTALLEEKVNALQLAGDFKQALEFALEHAQKLRLTEQKSLQSEAGLWIAAAKIDFLLGQYDDEMAHATEAMNRTNSQTCFSEWAAARCQQGQALLGKRKSRQAQLLYEELIPMLATALGPDHLTTLQSRRTLVLVLGFQGFFDRAEQMVSSLIADCRRALGPEHPETLRNRMTLASIFRSQGLFAREEQECRTVLEIQRRTLGADHPETWRSHMKLAQALYSSNTKAEAEQECREVVASQEKVLGPEHSRTLKTRTELATILYHEGKYPQAELEYRATMEIQERALGDNHPDLAWSCYLLGMSLETQFRFLESRNPPLPRDYLATKQKLPEAIELLRRAEKIWTKVFGAEYAYSKISKSAYERCEYELNEFLTE